MENVKALALIGIKHCGKTSIGKILAKRLSLPFADTDALIKSVTGKTARELFAEGGAPLMEMAEREACKEALKIAKKGGAIISTGGAFCKNPLAVSLLKEGCVFCLIEANFEVLYSRILKSAKKEGEMPAFLRCENPKERFASICEERMALYRYLAEITVKNNKEGQAEYAASAILRQLEFLYPNALNGAKG